MRFGKAHMYDSHESHGVIPDRVEFRSGWPSYARQDAKLSNGITDGLAIPVGGLIVTSAVSQYEQTQSKRRQLGGKPNSSHPRRNAVTDYGYTDRKIDDQVEHDPNLGATERRRTYLCGPFDRETPTASAHRQRLFNVAMSMSALS